MFIRIPAIVLNLSKLPFSLGLFYYESEPGADYKQTYKIHPLVPMVSGESDVTM